MSSFLSSDQVKFSAPLPSLEFKDQDISTPFLAARLIYDVDFLHDRVCCGSWKTCFARMSASCQSLRELVAPFWTDTDNNFCAPRCWRTDRESCCSCRRRGLPSHTRRQTLKATLQRSSSRLQNGREERDADVEGHGLEFQRNTGPPGMDLPEPICPTPSPLGISGGDLPEQELRFSLARLLVTPGAQPAQTMAPRLGLPPPQPLRDLSQSPLLDAFLRGQPLRSPRRSPACGHTSRTSTTKLKKKLWQCRSWNSKQKTPSRNKRCKQPQKEMARKKSGGRASLRF